MRQRFTDSFLYYFLTFSLIVFAPRAAAKSKASKPEPPVIFVGTVATGPSIDPDVPSLAPSIQINGPMGLRFRPGTDELWVVNSR